MSFIDFQELKGRVDIQAACSFLQLDLKQNGKQHRGPCPACEGSGERSLVVTQQKQVAYCFAAKQGGDVIWLASHIHGISPKEAAHLLAEEFGEEETAVKSNSVEDSRALTADTHCSKGHTSKEREFKPLSYLQADHKQVVGLGVLSDTAKHFECGHAPKGILRGKLAIPLHDQTGKLLAYCGRSYEGRELVFPSGFEPQTLIFNAHRVEDGDLYLARDPLDVLLAFENGVENVVSILTDDLGPTQLELLATIMRERGCSSVELIA